MNKQFVDALFADSKVTELRVLPHGTSSLHRDAETLQRAVLDAPEGASRYVTLNRPTEARRPSTGRALKNEDIGVITFLPFDFDPVRAKGSNSTASELQEAIDQRNLFVRSMTSRGWPMPAMGMSGNGAHALYRVYVKNTAATNQTVKAMYKLLASHFSTETVTFDRSVSNPARVWRLYGTINRKGPHTLKRPQRLSTFQAPGNWSRLPFSEVERLAGEALQKLKPSVVRVAPRVGGSGDYSTLDICGWFASRGAYIRRIEENKHEVICPWEDEHSSSSPADSIIYTSRGSDWPGFFCHHDHCAGRNIRDVLSLWSDADAYCSQRFAHEVVA